MQYLKLRYRLLPYIYSEAVRCAQAGLPMAAPLLLEYQDDFNTRSLDLQYLFGGSFLVAPVVSRARRRPVYLPAGEWVDFWTKKAEPGGRWVEAEAPLDKLPLWVKGGHILPLGPEMEYVDQKPIDTLTLELYAPQGSRQLLIHDEDKPDIQVAYTRQGDRLKVECSPAPGQVEVVLYAVRAVSAHRSGQPLSLHDCPGGQVVRFDGRQAGKLEFILGG
jgi:alpha-D-xyloside xylohydrolase